MAGATQSVINSKQYAKSLKESVTLTDFRNVSVNYADA